MHDSIAFLIIIVQEPYSWSGFSRGSRCFPLCRSGLKGSIFPESRVICCVHTSQSFLYHEDTEDAEDVAVEEVLGSSGSLEKFLHDLL